VKIFSASVMMALVSLSAIAADPSSPVATTAFLPQNIDTNVVTVAPSNSVEYAALQVQEASLIKQQHELELKLNKVFFLLHDTRTRVMRDDAELIALTKEIAAKQVALEKRTGEKYPDLGAQMKERDTMTKAHSDLGEKLWEVRKRQAILEGRIVADLKP